MDAWIALLTLLGLIAFSGMLVRVTHAIVYRVTGNGGKYSTVAAIFALFMLALAFVFYSVAMSTYGKLDGDGPGTWVAFAFYYCCLAAGVTVVGIILAAVNSTFESIVAGIRGD